MIGFLAGAGAEIFGAGPILGQLAACPQPPLAIMALITAGSIIPLYKGTAGDYLASLKETYGLPDGVFTPAMELLHARAAMVGIASLVRRCLAACRRRFTAAPSPSAARWR